MDPTEDLSARLLLKNILSTEPLRTPITRSASKAQSPSGKRRSSRLSKKDAGAQTPQEIMRRSMKHKLRESITRKSLPATTSRMTTSGLLRKTTPGLTSMLFDDDDTPRHLLRRILQTEPVRSPVVHNKAESEEPGSSSANSSISSKCSSIELSGLDLPDLTLGNPGTVAKGLSRKRPRRSLNVTAFEKRLKHASDFQEEHEESAENYSSLSLSSSTSLSLKTPFVDVRSEKRGLQRRASNRRKITEEEFGAAVNKQWMGGDHVKGVELNHSTYSDGFTLGLSELCEPNITTDIINCNTALYTQSDPMASTLSIMATQDKDTVMATQLQRQMSEQEQSKLGKDETEFVFPTEVGVMEELQNEQCVPEGQLKEEVGTAGSQSDEEEAESQSVKGDGEDTGADDSQSEEDKIRSQSEEEEAEPQSEKEGADDSQSGEYKVRSQSEEAETQSEKEGADDSQSGEDKVRSQSEEEEEAETQSEKGDEEEGPDDFKSGEDVEAGSQSEEAETQSEKGDEEEGQDDFKSGEDVEAGSQSEEEEAEPQSEKEGADDSQSGEDEVRSQSEEEKEEAETISEKGDGEEGPDDSQSGGDVEAGSQSEELGDDGEDYQHDQEDPDTNSQSEDKDMAESRDEDEDEEGKQASEQLEHISRRAHHSQGGLVVPFVTERGRSRVHSAGGVHISLEAGGSDGSPPRSGTPDVQESLTSGTEAVDCVADGENSFHLEMTHDIEEGSHLSDAPPEEEAAASAAVDPVEQEEEWEDEETEEFPCKTPAFVKEKRNFFFREHETSPSVLKNIQTSRTGEAVPAAKPKKVQKKTRGPTKKQACLPKSYLMSVFRHFAKTKVSPDVYPVLQETMDQFFDRMAEDLETYAHHAKRKTIDYEDVLLLLKRIGYVNDKVPVEVLIEKYLRMDQRRLLIPIATSGNVVVPRQRR
ncbi:centromere protein T isoform X2 [Solea solea]|uniref:centromere protein T isoform X2 n=1 Tax=Solea solea TaxID=90069 RepID=UPI00272D2FE6|nr:centromere protein T isoform X2 [Solea solea]